MEQAEFIQKTQKLCELYGKSLNETQAEFWYLSLRNFDAQIYEKAIGDYVKSNKYMPTISDLLGQIKETSQREKEKSQKEAQEQNVVKVPCDKCHGSGLIKYTKEHLYDYCCTCSCENGKRQRELYPFMLSYYDVLPHVENELHIPKKPKTTDPVMVSTTAPLDYDLSQIRF